MSAVNSVQPEMSGSAAEVLRDLTSEYQRSIVERAQREQRGHALEARDILDAYYREYSRARREVRRDLGRLLLSLSSLIVASGAFATIYLLVRHAPGSIGVPISSIALGVTTTAAGLSIALVVLEIRDRRMDLLVRAYERDERYLAQWHLLESVLRTKLAPLDETAEDEPLRSVLESLEAFDRLSAADRETIDRALELRNRIAHGSEVQANEVHRLGEEVRSLLARVQ